MVARPHTPDYNLWGAMRATVYRDSPHTLLELKEAIANFIRNILIELSHVFANKIRHVMCVYKHVGVISNIRCNLSKYEK
jgi:hypothetical protein